MKAPVFLSLVIYVAQRLVSGNPDVMESRSAYSCCGNPKIKFDPQCETTWTISGKTIAFSNGLSTKCTYPCKKLEPGVMMLDECADVNVTMITSEADEAEEIRIYYDSILCSGSPRSQGSVGLMLLAVVIGGLIIC